MMNRRAFWSGIAGAATLLAGVADAQVRTVDPNQAIDNDLGTPQSAPARQPSYSEPVPAEPDTPADTASPPVAATTTTPAPAAQARADATTAAAETYQRDDVLAAAEGVFGKGAQGLAGIVEKILGEQGRPNAYIAGREASGALVVGVR